jgi:osmotically-inducible protein OsmY
MKFIHLSRRNSLMVSCAVALALPLAACSDDQAARNPERAEQPAEARQDADGNMAGEGRMMDGEGRMMSANGGMEDTMESMQHRAGEMMAEAGDAASDMRMHMALEMKLAANDQLSAMMINTDVKDGVAHLEGEVATDAQREMAAELAMTVDGIESVMNDLQVNADAQSLGEQLAEGIDDAALTTRVKSRLLASENTSGLEIGVETTDSVVTLSGQVDSDTERELAELIAANTPGVSSVRNELNAGNE